jgi:hypothetical protein
MPLTLNTIVDFNEKTLEEIKDENFVYTINESFFNKIPKVAECFEIVGMTKDKQKVIFKA